MMLVVVLTLVACAHPSDDDLFHGPIESQRFVSNGGGDSVPVDEDEGVVTYTEEREPCADRNPLRNIYFGDLHVHTTLSYDAYLFGTRRGPADAYRFALGDIPHQANEESYIKRPLDFAAATDHGERMGVWSWCDDPDSPHHDSKLCRVIRGLGYTEGHEYLELFDEADDAASDGSSSPSIMSSRLLVLTMKKMPIAAPSSRK